jgi:hypothetical protein
MIYVNKIVRVVGKKNAKHTKKQTFISNAGVDPFNSAPTINSAVPSAARAIPSTNALETYHHQQYVRSDNISIVMRDFTSLPMPSVKTREL